MSAPERIWIAGRHDACGQYYEEAVEAEGEHGGTAMPYVPEATLTAAQAEIARLRAERDAAMAGRVKVKPLVWRESYGVFRAETAFGEYVATGRILRFLSRAERVCDDLEAAKAAAQADYEARILAALQPDTERAEPVACPDLYLICKHGGYYRPDASGYTRNVNEAGRYTLDEAIKHTHPNGSNGPRDGMTYIPAPAPQAREITVQEAAEVLLSDDIAIACMAEGIHDGPMMADDHWFSAARPQGSWCVDAVRAALRALTGEAR